MKCFAADYGSYTDPDHLDYGKLVASGFLLHLIGTTGNPFLIKQVMYARLHGEVELYVIPSTWSSDGGHAMDAALTAAHLVYPSGRVWIDVEPLPRETPDPRTCRAWIESARKCAEGGRFDVGIYSNQRCWKICTGPDAGFDADVQALPKWDACYDGLPFSGDSGPWGGSTDKLINQFSDLGMPYTKPDGEPGVMNIDLNWVEGERMMTDEQITAALGNILGTLSEFGKRTDFLAAELYKAVDGRADKAKEELAYTFAAGGKPTP